MKHRPSVSESPIGALEPLTLAHFDFRNEHLISQRGNYTLAVARALATRTRVNKLKKFEMVDANLPRFHYDPYTGGERGLLGEGNGGSAVIQMLLQSGWAGATSGSPGTAPTSWTLGFGTGTITTVEASQFGNADAAQAVRFECDAGERVYFAQAVTFVAGTRYCISAYLEEVVGAIGDMIAINPGTGTFTVVQAVTSPGAVGRQTYIVDCTGSGTGEVRVGVGCNGTVGGPAQAKISRPQCEARRYPTTYIPSTTATVTANIDVITVPFAVAAPITVFCEFFRTAQDIDIAEFPSPYAIDDGTANERLAMWLRTDNQNCQVLVRDGGVDQVTSSLGTHTINGRNRTCVAYAANNTRGSLNGAAVVVDSACTMPASGTLRLCGGETPLNDGVLQLAIFSGVLPDATMQSLALNGI